MRNINVPDAYDAANETAFRRTVMTEDGLSHKRNTDVELGRGHRVIFTDTVTGTRYALTVASGVLTLTAL